MNRLVEHFFQTVIAPYLEPRMRSGAIKATKVYIEAVKHARGLVIQGFVIGAMSSILISGIVLVVFGVLALLPLLPQVVPVIAVVLGSIMTGVTAYLFNKFFKEENWLKASKSYELMEAALAPWENEMSPPNPLAVMRGEGPKGVIFEPSEKEMTKQQRIRKNSNDIESAMIAGDKSHLPHADVSAANIGGSAAIMAPEAPVIIPPLSENEERRLHKEIQEL